MATLITNISTSIRNGDDDTALNAIIQSYLDERAMTETVSEWRVANYSDLRRWAYPPLADWNDIQVKLNSGDTDLETEGNAEKATYINACLAVKQRFPKT